MSNRVWKNRIDENTVEWIGFHEQPWWTNGFIWGAVLAVGALVCAIIGWLS